MNTLTTTTITDGKTERISPTDNLPTLGQWYWVKGDADASPTRAKGWFGCVVQVGSNFVELCGPSPDYGNGELSTRVHLNKIDAELTFEPDHKRVLAEYVAKYQQQVSELMNELVTLTSSLGVSPLQRLGHQPSEDSGKSLAILSGQNDISAYKAALIRAQETTIPELKDKLRRANDLYAAWIKAEIIPMRAMIDQQTDVIDTIKAKVLTVELYAGVGEQVHQIAEGAPADMDEKLRVFQRLLYCDEECLLAYHEGGMDVRNMTGFFAWLAKPENRDRILPFKRCMVAMRVRRVTKERDTQGGLRQILDSIEMDQADKLTYLFVRNGENLYAVSTQIDFGELIFPSLREYDPSEPMMLKVFCGKVKDSIPRRAYETLRDNFYEWHPFDESSVYYDEGCEFMAEALRKYNRVAVIIQGLFDRSECLAPHRPVKSWTHEGFRAAITLVYDGEGLTHGEPPSFEEYRTQCNASITESSILVGQQFAWMKKEAEIECRRIDNSWRERNNSYRPKLFKPMGDEGPGYLAAPAKVMRRAGKATFTWLREARSVGRYGDMVRNSVTVPFTELFNVSAYNAGDYKQFFADPRTRAKYLQWAPLLMAAEDYHSGRLKANRPMQD
ncbi:hypothetical protein [Pseudomonas aeruginosa]|uniref:hypothetical protein n=1 Tax=Pseudomonas aeruginosa TaxID=287 RepID=UPI0039E7D571